ncbi:MAG TPA: chloride channel protein [Steroidobacteraceae bacterium]|nr:chloride channel protein [Steroidobacteraceae bacterium]
MTSTSTTATPPSDAVPRFRRIFTGRAGVIIAAAIVGTATGIASILFREAFAVIQRLAFGAALAAGTHVAEHAPIWIRLGLPVAGGLAVGLLAWFLLPDRRPHGVADVIEAGMLRGGAIPLRTGVLAAAASAVSLGAGASVGREGPMVHLGATLGTWLTTRLGLEPRWLRRMLACGAAAGVAASFNAPLAGAIFAAEVVVGRYTLHTFAPIVIASVAGTIVSRLWYGDAPGFSVPAVTLGSYWEVPVFGLLGIAAAGAAVLLIRSVGATAALYQRGHVHPIAQPVIGGLVVGAVAMVLPGVLGVGYETTSVALSGTMSIGIALALTAAKVIATGASLGSGFGGGIFSPALMIGATLGSAAGTFALQLFPDASAGPTAYALVGMGAVAAAVLGAPLSTTLIVLELTGNYPVTLAVMLATVIASVLVNEVWGYSFFSWQLKRRGIDPGVRRADALLAEMQLQPLAFDSLAAVEDDVPCRQIAGSERGATERIVVVDAQGNPLGTVAVLTIRNSAREPDEAPLRLGELERRNDPVVPPGASLAQALAALTENPAPAVLMPDPETPQRFWMIRRDDIMRAYHAILDRVYAEERGDFRSRSGGE